MSIVQTVGRQGIFEPYFCQKKVQTKIIRVGRSDIDAHTYESMQNLKYGDGSDLFPMVWKGFLYILNHPKLVQTITCPYQASSQVGQTKFGLMSTFWQFFLGPFPQVKFAQKVIFPLKGKFVLKLHFAYFALTNSSLCTLGKIYN